MLCSHIHSVNILYLKTTAADLKIPATELETTSDSDMEKKRKELSNIIQQDKQLQESKQLADLKIYELNQIAELSELIQCPDKRHHKYNIEAHSICNISG